VRARAVRQRHKRQAPLLSNLSRYFLIAAAALLAGIALNLAMGPDPGAPIFSGPSFALLVAMYATLHAVALSFIALLSRILPLRVRVILYPVLSASGFLVSLYFLSPNEFGGIHLFVIFWGGLVLAAMDYAWRANRQSGNGTQAS